ncbi:acyltransferase domain-containing protein [Rhizobium ruizarguesonis]
MTIAFTFPGQGSQAVGMGKDLAENFAEARAVFEEVDEALGEKLSDVMFNGPEDTLTLTANAQPALMAVSIAVVRVLEAKGLDLKSKVAYVAGHSLGEYSALCAAGTFSLADTARLLRIRGNAMQAAVPVGVGAMAAITGILGVYAYRAAPASTLAPLQYLEIVSATIFAWLVFGDFPDAVKWLGIAIIVAAGFYILWRERRFASKPVSDTSEVTLAP